MGLIHHINAANKASLFQTEDTTTPVTTNNQPIGRMSDLSGGTSHAVQATAGDRPVYLDPFTNEKGGVSFVAGDNLKAALGFPAAGMTHIFFIKTPADVAPFGGEKGFFSWAENNAPASGVPAYLLQLHAGTIRAYVASAFVMPFAVAPDTLYLCYMRYNHTNSTWYFKVGEMSEQSHVGAVANGGTSTHVYYGSGYLAPGSIIFGESRIYNEFLSGDALNVAVGLVHTAWYVIGGVFTRGSATYFPCRTNVHASGLVTVPAGVNAPPANGQKVIARVNIIGHPQAGTIAVMVVPIGEPQPASYLMQVDFELALKENGVLTDYRGRVIPTV